jgi:UDP-galactopyranose mutase
MKYDYLIVGAGLAGCSLAERLSNQLNKKVLIVEKRAHIGSNCYDRYNDHDILIKPYGPHIFHTKIKRVWEYLNRFTSVNNYLHRVIANVKGKEVYFPINLDTMEKLKQHAKTTICYEYPTDEGDPYYPIPREDNQKLYEKYKAEADKLKNVFFIGRLAQYRYLNMDQVVNQALELFEQLCR